MAKENEKRQNEKAVSGANAVIDYLGATGTGQDKIAIAREAIVDVGEASTEEDGAKLVLAHLKRRGAPKGTVQKVEQFIEGGMKPAPQAVPGVFVPGATAPGTLPAGVHVPAARPVASPPTK